MIDLLGTRSTMAQFLVFWSPVILVVPILVIQAALGYDFSYGALVVVLVVSGLAWFFATSDQVAVCEGGLVLGSFAPFLRPMCIRWDQVDLETIAFITPYKRLVDVMNPPGASGLSQVSSTRRGGVHSQAALSWLGPTLYEVKTGQVFAERVPTAPKGSIWCVGIGDTRLDRARIALVTALTPIAGSAIHTLEARLRSPIDLSSDQETAVQQIPGYNPPKQ